MKNGRKLRGYLVLAAITVFALGVMIAPPANADGKKPRPDVILMTLGEPHTPEMPPAVFMHDKHTKDLAKIGQDCTVCHVGLEGNTPFRYVAEAPASTKNPVKQTAQKAQDAYHASCIGCHADMESRGQSTGPLDGECRVCHSDRPIATNFTPLKVDKSLHYIHISSPQIVNPDDPSANCGVCHHSYDAQLKQLVWEPGTEQACSVCHGVQDGIPSLQNAMHDSCVQCHASMVLEARAVQKAEGGTDAKNDKADKKKAAKSKAAKNPAPLLQPEGLKTGPDTCGGCHTATAQAGFRTVQPVPRLMRGQPDATVLLPVSSGDSAKTPVGEPGSGMSPVLFNHKSHEAATDSCSVCHHVRIENGGCTVCHTVQGTKEGNFIQLSQAMHSPDAEQSCVGCHIRQISSRPECAGCHVAIKPMSQNSCASCHKPVNGISQAAIADGSALAMGKEALAHIAERNLAEQHPAKPLSPEDMPETVTIGVLSKEFAPSVLPHRAMYKALVDGMGDSALASAFHTSPLATCAACHHHSPVEGLATPPKCASCHGAQGDALAVNSNRPSLKVAYHQQCMTCHDRMQITRPAATDCTACHAVRK